VADADGIAEFVGDGAVNFGVTNGVGCGEILGPGDGVDCGDAWGWAGGDGDCPGAAGCCPSARYPAGKPITSPSQSFNSGLNVRRWPKRVNQLKRSITSFAVSGSE